MIGEKQIVVRYKPETTPTRCETKEGALELVLSILCHPSWCVRRPDRADRADRAGLEPCVEHVSIRHFIILGSNSSEKTVSSNDNDVPFRVHHTLVIKFARELRAKDISCRE